MEKRLGIVLPKSYRELLLRYNGGRPDPSGFKYKNESGPYTDS
jgi:hypothetical protein